MIPRLYINAQLADGAALALAEAQSHYVKNVMRRAPGDALALFNARDGEFAAIIERADKKGVMVRLGERLRAPSLDTGPVLLFAPVKRDAVDLIVEKASELGIGEIHPVITARTQSQRVNVERLAAIAVEAAEQCGRLSVPQVFEPVSLDQALAAFPAAFPEGRRLLFCDEAGDDPTAPWGGDAGRAAPILEVIGRAGATQWALLIGPEGGFAPEERARLRALPFVSAASLGPRILRADTAAIAALALLQAAAGDWRPIHRLTVV